MPFTTNYAHNILNYAFAKVKTLPAPEAVYIGLTSNDPEEDGGFLTELPGTNGYGRVLVSLTDKNGPLAYPDVFGSASDRKMTNQKQINWTKATGDWPRIKGFFLSSSPTVGEKSAIFFYGALDLSEVDKAAGGLLVEAGAVALFDPQTFRIEFPAQDVALTEEDEG